MHRLHASDNSEEGRLDQPFRLDCADETLGITIIALLVVVVLTTFGVFVSHLFEIVLKDRSNRNRTNLVTNCGS